MERMHTVDRVSLGSLALANLGAGVFLLGVEPLTWVHALFAVVALVLAAPAAASAVVGWFPPAADEGVLVNIAALLFVTLEVAFSVELGLQTVGLVVLLAAATAATAGLYWRLFGAVRWPVAGRHVRGGSGDH